MKNAQKLINSSVGNIYIIEKILDNFEPMDCLKMCMCTNSNRADSVHRKMYLCSGTSSFLFNAFAENV